MSILRGRRGTLWRSTCFSRNVCARPSWQKSCCVYGESSKKRVFLDVSEDVLMSFCVAGVALYTPLSTLHCKLTLYTRHCTLYTPHSTLSTLHSTLHSLHSTLHTPHSPHSTLYTPHFTLHTPHSTSTFDSASPYILLLYVICIQVRWFLLFFIVFSYIYFLSSLIIANSATLPKVEALCKTFSIEDRIMRRLNAANIVCIDCSHVTSLPHPIKFNLMQWFQYVIKVALKPWLDTDGKWARRVGNKFGSEDVLLTRESTFDADMKALWEARDWQQVLWPKLTKGATIAT